MSRRYRATALAPPRHAIVESPISAAIATGIATGVRWLQRHPEMSRALFGHALDAATIDAAAREAVADVIAAVETVIGPGMHATVDSITTAVRRVTAGTPGWVPPFARASERAIETADAAPDLAAAEGWVTDAMHTDPIGRVRSRIVAELSDAERSSLQPVNDLIGGAIAFVLTNARPSRGTYANPAQFLGQVLRAWWHRTRRLDPLADDCAVITYFGRGRSRGPDAAVTRDIVCIARRASRVFVHADFWIAAGPPAWVSTDPQSRLHRVGGPAIGWRDSFGLCYLHGVRVSPDIALGRFGIAEILNEGNSEVRRTMIELYERDDRGRFLREADPEVVQLDWDRLGHKRRLLRVRMDRDEPYVGIEVVNSTPEPDGSHRRYILRVPPETTTCAAAVAWTFGMTEDEYEPAAES